MSDTAVPSSECAPRHSRRLRRWAIASGAGVALLGVVLAIRRPSSLPGTLWVSGRTGAIAAEPDGFPVRLAPVCPLDDVLWIAPDQRIELTHARAAGVLAWIEAAGLRTGAEGGGYRFTGEFASVPGGVWFRLRRGDLCGPAGARPDEVARDLRAPLLEGREDAVRATLDRVWRRRRLSAAGLCWGEAVAGLDDAQRLQAARTLVAALADETPTPRERRDLAIDHPELVVLLDVADPAAQYLVWDVLALARPSVETVRAVATFRNAAGVRDSLCRFLDLCDEAAGQVVLDAILPESLAAARSRIADRRSLAAAKGDLCPPVLALRVGLRDAFPALRLRIERARDAGGAELAAVRTAVRSLAAPGHVPDADAPAERLLAWTSDVERAWQFDEATCRWVPVADSARRR